MKNLFLWLTFAATFLLSAAEPEKFDVKLELMLLVPPTVNYSGVSGFPSPKNPRTNRWLMLECRYSAVSKSASPALANMHFLDNVEMEARVLFTPGVTVNGKQIFSLYTGKVLFWTVALDGSKREALMFLPAQLIDRCSVSTTASGSPAVAAPKDFSAEVVFRQNGAVIGRAYRNVPGGSLAQQERRFQLMVASVPKELTFEGAILSRGKSPWAAYCPDRYDTEREFPAAMR